MRRLVLLLPFALGLFQPAMAQESDSSGTLTLSKPLVAQIAAYLTERPYKEVAPLIDELKKEVVPAKAAESAAPQAQMHHGASAPAPHPASPAKP